MEGHKNMRFSQSLPSNFLTCSTKILMHAPKPYVPAASINFMHFINGMVFFLRSNEL